MITLKNYIFQETNLENLYLHTLITNERAIKSFKKAGFSEIGVVRNDGMNFIKMYYKKALRKRLIIKIFTEIII